MALTGGNKYKVVPVTFPEDVMAKMDEFIYENITLLNDQWADFRNSKLPKYEKIYKGIPREEEKNFPWKNASNIVIQVVGSAVDTLQAKIIGSIYELTPLWPVTIVGRWEAQKEAEEQRAVLEEFLSYCGVSPDALDAYRVESLWCGEMIKIGHSVIKTPYEKDVEQVMIGIEGGDPVEETNVKFEGPKPEKIPAADFMADVKQPTLEDCPFVVHIARLNKHQLQQRIYKGVYNRDKVEKVLRNPDSNSPDSATIEKWQKEGFDASQVPGSCVYDIYECHFEWWHNEKKYQLICNYHYKTRTRLRCVYKFTPKNDSQFIMARLGYNDDGLLGRGYCDLLHHYQEEITTNHNQRVDKRTLLNTNVFRIGGNSKLDAHFKFYPGMSIPAEQGDFEAIPLGADTYPNSVTDEMLSLKLSEDRSGVGTATSGMGGLGAGTVGKTSGAYSSMGTYSVMQDGSRRVGQNITDFRYAHMKFGKQAANIYAHFGADRYAALFGLDAELLRTALDNFLGKKLGFLIQAATSSINREIEKQNYLLLSSTLQRHYTTVGQLVQAIQNPQIDPALRGYFNAVIQANNSLMAKILQAFNIGDKSRILPEPNLGENNGASRPDNQLEPPNPAEQAGNSEPLQEQPNVQDSMPILPSL